MLVLARKVGQDIVIRHAGEIVRVKIVRAGPQGVRLGIIANKHVRVDREEVDQRRQGDEL